MNKPKSIEEWKEIITTARTSGLSDKDWCLANDVSINSFYYNVRRLRRHACEVPETSGKHTSVPQAVVPLEIIDEVNSPEIELLSDRTATPININCKGISVSINNNASKDLITSVINALKGGTC